MAKSAKEVREKFAEENMYCEIYEHENGCISIEIEWGDWKHDHRLLQNVMEQNGFECVDKYITASDCDCYDCEYTFQFK